MPRHVSSPSMGFWHRGVDQFCVDGKSVLFNTSTSVDMVKRGAGDARTLWDLWYKGGLELDESFR